MLPNYQIYNYEIYHKFDDKFAIDIAIIPV